jgi:hypothetical protein
MLVCCSFAIQGADAVSNSVFFIIAPELRSARRFLAMTEFSLPL